MTLVMLASPVCFPLSYFIKGFHEYISPPGVPVLYSTQLKQRVYLFERRDVIDSEIIYN
jgi:hypothetical protein